MLYLGACYPLEPRYRYLFREEAISSVEVNDARAATNFCSWHYLSDSRRAWWFGCVLAGSCPPIRVPTYLGSRRHDLSIISSRYMYLSCLSWPELTLADLSLVYADVARVHANRRSRWENRGRVIGMDKFSGIYNWIPILKLLAPRQPSRYELRHLLHVLSIWPISCIGKTLDL